MVFASFRVCHLVVKCRLVLWSSGRLHHSRNYVIKLLMPAHSAHGCLQTRPCWRWASTNIPQRQVWGAPRFRPRRSATATRIASSYSPSPHVIVIIRPPDMSTDLYFTKIGQILESNCNLKTHVEYLRHPPTNRVPQNHLFGRRRNLTVNLTAYVIGMKHDIHKRASALQTTRGLLHRTKTTWTLVHKRLQIGSEFSPTLRKFCIPLHCHASQTEISKRNSTKLCQTVVGRSR